MNRFRVKAVAALTDMRLLVVFDNFVVKLFDVKKIIPDFPEYADLNNEDLFSLVKIESGGYGVSWTSELDASEGELWENGEYLPLGEEDIATFVLRNQLSRSLTYDVAGILKELSADEVTRMIF